MNSPKKRLIRENDWSQRVEHTQVPNGTGLGVRRSKRPLSACYTSRKSSMETSHKSVKRLSSEKKVMEWYKSDRWRVVIVFGQATECH